MLESLFWNGVVLYFQCVIQSGDGWMIGHHCAIGAFKRSWRESPSSFFKDNQYKYRSIYTDSWIRSMLRWLVLVWGSWVCVWGCEFLLGHSWVFKQTPVYQAEQRLGARSQWQWIWLTLARMYSISGRFMDRFLKVFCREDCLLPWDKIDYCSLPRNYFKLEHQQSWGTYILGGDSGRWQCCWVMCL